MCGIVGYVGNREAREVILPALARLEYRGYDSAGIATLNGSGISVQRCVGKLQNLRKLVEENPVSGRIGIGHTRWATHGRPTEGNAHPHAAGRVAVIHNGIVENYLELREELQKRGRQLASETDTEVIAHLIDEAMDEVDDLVEATRLAVRWLTGSFAIVAIEREHHDRLVAAKTATPIVLGVGDGENLVASDVPALLDSTRDVIFLEDGEIAEITPEGIEIRDFEGRPVERAPQRISWDLVAAQKDGHRHFLGKEISEQPEAVTDTLRGRVQLASGDVDLPELEAVQGRLAEVERIILVACGTARHSCLVGESYLRRLTGRQVLVDYASEFRYRAIEISPTDLVIPVSQSGETADTLGALEVARSAGALSISICNVLGSSIARASDAVVYTHAGPEISVCSTKAFTTQVVALMLLAIHLGRRFDRLTSEDARELLSQVRLLPPFLRETLNLEREIEDMTRDYAAAEHFLYLGRGLQFPIALEGALKLKEISYIHAEAYPAGEMKHGPIALVTEEMPVVVLVPRDELYGKTLSNLKEVESRGGRILAITDSPTEDLERISRNVLVVPRVHPLLTPLVTTIPLQILAYHIAVARGTDVDQPRNLAKSVTVE